MAKIARPEIEIEELTGEGSGILKKNALLYGKELGEHCRMYTEVVMPEGSDLAFHVHEGESETYYILTGTGIYNDNGTKYLVKAGDVVFCDDGEGHGLLNNGKEDLKFIALILKK